MRCSSPRSHFDSMLDGLTPPLIVVATGLLLTAVRQRGAGFRRGRGFVVDAVVVLVIVCVTMALEFEMGRTPLYRNGPVRLWSGDINSDQNSQQAFDPYSFTHVIHGAAFFGLTRLIPGAASLGLTAIVVATLESAWEAYENTEQVINRYRAETVSLGYRGDSLLNSFFDIACCMAGLFLAWRRPAWMTVAWVLGVEIVLALWIRDNLTLNILMLIHPIKAIKAWQLAARARYLPAGAASAERDAVSMFFIA